MSHRDFCAVPAAIATSPDSEQALVGIPTRRALEVMLQHLGFTYAYFDWASIAEAGVGVDDYRCGRHCTLRASRTRTVQPSWPQPALQAAAPPDATARAQGSRAVGASGALSSALEKMPAVIVDGQALSLGQVLAEAFERQDTGFLEKAMRHHLITARASAYGIAVQPAELLRMRDIFCRAQGLADDEALARWLEGSGLSQQQLDTQLTDLLICGKLKGKVVEPQLEAYFHTHRAHFDRLVLLRLEVASRERALRLAEVLRSGAMPADLTARLASTAEADPSLAMSLYTQVYPVDLPEPVGTLQAGEVSVPLWRHGLWEIFRVEARQPACLDQATRMRLHHLLFDQWLEAERQRATICIPLQLNASRTPLPDHDRRQLEVHA